MPETLLHTMKKMEKIEGGSRLEDLYEDTSSSSSKARATIDSIAYEYGFETENTRIMATPGIAIIYSEENNRVQIGDFFVAPIDENLTEEQKAKTQSYITRQMKTALKQLKAKGNDIDISNLDESKREGFQELIDKIEQDERREI